MELPVILGAYLGLPRSEICALTIDDIDLDKKTISINKAMAMDDHAKWVVKPPKSYSGYRIIPIPDIIAEKIRAIKAVPGHSLIGVHPNTLTNRFIALQKSVYGEIRFRFHDLRHYNASVMLAKNVPNRYAQERLGHATDNMLKNVYQHLFQEKQKEISEDLNDYFSRAMQHEMQHEDD